MITVICCYNNKEMFNDFVVKSLQSQDTQYELIGIDNSQKAYNNAAIAYNSTYKKAQGEYLIFCHQDIYFPESDTLQKIENRIKENPDSIIGFCGMLSSGSVRSNLKYRKNLDFITMYQIDCTVEAESVDECCFAISKRMLIDNDGFNEMLCDGWHLYAVELCLRLSRNGTKSIVIPEVIYHKEDGSQGLETDYNFLKVMRRLAKEYKEKGIIFAPCYICSTNPVKRELRLARSNIANYLRGKDLLKKDKK